MYKTEEQSALVGEGPRCLMLKALGHVLSWGVNSSQGPLSKPRKLICKAINSLPILYFSVYFLSTRFF